MEYPGPGSAFGRYDVGERLGQGGMGLVFRAVHRDLDRPVALKLLSPTLIATTSYRERFLREARVLARLDTPHVVRVHDAGDEDGWLFIATELIAGGDLQQQVDRHGPLPPPLALRLVAEAADGLAAAHAAGVLHRDLKPSNVLLRPRVDGAPSAVLCDLGIAKAEAEDGLTTTGLIGTPSYMAPERHDGQDATEASDVYELGCVLWTLLAGRAPYGGTWGQVAIAHLQAPVPQLPAGHPAVALNPLLARVLAKAPADRFASATALAAATREAGDRVGPATPPPPTSPPPAEPTVVRASGEAPPPSVTGADTEPSPRRRGPLLVAAAVLALVVGVAAVVLLVTRDGDAGDAARDGGSTASSGEPGSNSSSASESTSEPTSSAPNTVDPVGPGLPAVGECRALSYDDVPAASDGTRPQSCDEPSTTARTILVGRLDERVDNEFAELRAECLPVLARELGVPVEDVGASLAVPIVYWPDDQQWAGGARWWRCDAVLLRRGVLQPLPDLGGIYERPGQPIDGYRACLDRQQDVVSCADDPTAYYEFAIGLPTAAPETWPGQSDIERIGASACGNFVEGDQAVTSPSPEAWDSGLRFFDCWRRR